MVIPDLTDPASREAFEEYLQENGDLFIEEIFPGGELPFGEFFPFDDEGFGFGFEMLPPFGDGEGPLFGELPEELIGDLNARADELAAFLDERGVGYEVEEGPMGIRVVIPDLTDPAAEEALEEFFEQHGGMFDFSFEFPGHFGGFFEEPAGSEA
jgi:hypothetical protein